MRLQLKSIILALAITLAVARPNPEAQPEYRSADEEAADPSSSEARSQNSISSEEREADLRLQPYGALKLAVRDEPWGALRVSVALAEQERIASERLLTERESVEVAATPEPDTEIVESLSDTDDAPRCDKEAPTTLVLRPYAKAVAGAGGTAIAAPESRAITRHASDVIVFEPHVVAVVGPGGHAVATSRLIIENISN